MTLLESSVLGILAVLLAGYCGYMSIRSPLARMLCLAATMGAFWLLVIIAGKEIFAWLIADIFG